MKKSEIIKNANIGSSIELSNIELTLIKSKWNNILFHLPKMKEIDEELSNSIEEFSGLIDKMTGKDVLDLQQIEEELFDIKPLTEKDLVNIINESTGTVVDVEHDAERAKRIFEDDGETI